MTKQASATRTATTPGTLQTTYDALCTVLMRHVPPYVARSGDNKLRQELHLAVPKPVTISGHYGATPKKIGIVSVILQKGYVVLHYVPLYLEPELGDRVSPRLMKLLKGKTCFHVKQSDAELERDIDAALKIGTEYFHAQGWI